MNWGSFDNFVNMGGYGVYVWGSYAMALVCIVIELWALARRARRARAEQGA